MPEQRILLSDIEISPKFRPGWKFVLQSAAGDCEELFGRCKGTMVNNFIPVNKWTVKSTYLAHQIEEVLDIMIKPFFKVIFTADASHRKASSWTGAQPGNLFQAPVMLRAPWHYSVDI
ncbi:hypothetical protein VTN02DRAFT_3962 [Thermoascus thermophilus]